MTADRESLFASETSWLVQRLQKPLQSAHPVLGKDNPFAFGGGLRNGGIPQAGMDLLREIWRFDYMGAAEFEFGAVPEALSRLAKADLCHFAFDIPLREVAANWRDKSKETPEGEATIYVICPSGWKQEVERRIRGWAADDYPKEREFQLKESTRLASSLRPVEDWDRDICGWLEIDNGFLFFSDEEMWGRASALFGLEEAVAS